MAHARYAVNDVQVCGVTVPRGAVVHAFHASANRDESRWERPDEFDISRPRLTHASFGFGVHLCIGKHLARQESETAVTMLLDLVPGLRLDPDASPDEYRVRGLRLRKPRRVPVRVA